MDQAIPARRRWLNENGFRLAGVPVHIVRHGIIRHEDSWHRSTTVNLLDRPKDFRKLLSRLLVYGVGRHRGVTINYPVEWKAEFRLAARKLVPKLKRGRNNWFTAWRIYGKEL